MNPKSDPQTIPDRISSQFADELGLDERIEKAFSNQIAHESFRRRVKEIFDDCVDAVPFMNKVKSYAGTEIDDRLFNNMKVWIGLFATITFTAIITVMINNLIPK